MLGLVAFCILMGGLYMAIRDHGVLKMFGFFFLIVMGCLIIGAMLFAFGIFLAM